MYMDLLALLYRLMENRGRWGCFRWNVILKIPVRRDLRQLPTHPRG